MPRDADRGARAPEVLPDQPWHRLPKEPPTAYHWFSLYRDMKKPRSKRRLALENGRGSAAVLTDWSKRWKWTERVDALDAMLDAEHRAAQIEYVREAGRQRAQLVVETLDVILARLTGRAGEVDPDTGEVLTPGVRAIDPSMLDARDLAALGNMAQKMQTAAEEAAGVKPLDEQQVHVKLSFDLDGRPGVGHTVVEALGEPQPPRELSRGEPEADRVGGEAESV